MGRLEPGQQLVGMATRPHRRSNPHTRYSGCRVLARGFKLDPQKVEGRALVVGPWVLGLPAFISGFMAVLGVSYMMYSAFVGGGLISTVTMLLIQRGILSEDLGEWIAKG